MTRLPITCLSAALLCACGTKYIAELEQQEQASSEDGSTGGDDGPGQTVTSGAETTTSGAASSDTGTPVECEPDPNAVCGPDPKEVGAFLPPPAPVSSPVPLPVQTAYDCPITELDGSDPSNRRIILDCGLEFPTDVSCALPDETFAKLALDQTVHVEFTGEEDGNGNAMWLSIDDHPLVAMMNGTTVDPYPGVAVFDPFTVTVEDDLCLAPCTDDENQCYAQDRQRLHFWVDGEEVAAVWGTDETTVSVGGVDYLLTVGFAVGAEVVNPDSWACMNPSFSWYSFRIADVSP